MTFSLSVLLPVSNAQATLESLVTALLEAVSDLTPQCDLLIADQGSTDATIEIATELATRFPQVGLAAHPAPLSRAEILALGLGHTRGEVLMYRAEDCELDLYEAHKLWQRVAQYDVVLARSASKAGLGWLPRLPVVKSRGWQGPEARLFMVRRRIVEAWHLADERGDFFGYLGRKGLPWIEVDLRERATTIAENSARSSLLKAGRVDAGNSPRGTARQADRPNYLDRIKAFALGE